jgi:release factor glutamine methyltransferase
MGANNLTDPNAADAGARSIEQLLERGLALLAAHGDAPRLQAELLLAHILERPRSYLIAHRDESVAPAAAAAYQTLLAQAAAGWPIAYLTGEREFWSRSLKVSPAVLVPRPETELLVERCLALCAAAGPQRLCDLGTGSGAIALALALERPEWRITATDRSSAALELAQTNAARLGVTHVEWLLGDWFAPLAARRFDLIASNPPYVAAGDPALWPLRHEPREALTPGVTGLEALLHIVSEATDYLVPGGWLVLEHGVGQAAEVMQALQARGYARVRGYRDLSGCERTIEAQWP